MSDKIKGLLANATLYILAFAIALIPFCMIDNIFLAEAAFTATATFVIYIVTCFVPDTSLYDPYWSVAPPVMLIIAMIKYNYWSANAVILLSAFLIWSIRLTGNWVITYKGLLHEDWRYKMYRDKCTPFGFAVINFIGLQFVPTIVVYAGLIGAFHLIETDGFSLAVIPGITVMILGVSLEFVSDRAIHGFLKENNGQNKTCDVAIWHYSRHPNYLGEMTFWTGVFISFACVLPNIWYFGTGFLLIILLFLTVSIPMMEKHNMERRADYEEYKARTSVLIPLPNKKNN